MKYLTLLLFPIFLSCQEAVKLNKDNVSNIVYSYNDASLPPEYHRSYVITIVKNELNIVVDSYGDILANEVYPIKTETFSTLIDVINDANLVSGSVAVDGCDGGTSEDLEIFEGENIAYSGYFDHCGGNEIPESYGNLPAVYTAIRKLIPNLSELLK